MSVKIRLARGGRKKQPFYQIVVADSRQRRDGRFLERLGYINPALKEEGSYKIDAERANYWLSVGAEVTDKVAQLFIQENLGSEKQRAKWAAAFNRRRSIEEARLAEIQAKADAEAAAKAAAEAAEAAEAAAEEAAE